MSTQAEKRAVSDIDAAIGANLCTVREKRGLSRIYVAGAIGVSEWQLSKYENGRDRIAAGRLFLCATALNVPVSRFFRGIEARHG